MCPASQDGVQAINVTVAKVDLPPEEVTKAQHKRCDESIMQCWVWGTEGDEWRDCRGLVQLRAQNKAAAEQTNRRLSSANQGAVTFLDRLKGTEKTSGLEGWSKPVITMIAEDSVLRPLYATAFKLKAGGTAAPFQQMLQRRRVRLARALVIIMHASNTA